MQETQQEPIEKIRERIQAFCNKHKLIFEDQGECGFGRECVGLNVGDKWLDYNPLRCPDYDHIPELQDDRFYAPDGVDAYHKHDCFAVLGRGDDAIRQLDKWIQNIVSQGEVEVVQYETGATGMQALLTGVFGKALKFK